MHALDSAGKHTVLTPAMHFSYVEGFILIDLATGERTPADTVMIGPVVGGRAVAFEAPEGCAIDADPAPIRPPTILFPEIDIFPNKPVIAALAWIFSALEATGLEFVHLRHWADDQRRALARLVNGRPVGLNQIH